MPYEDEQILVVPTELFRKLGYFQGFTKNVDVLQPLLRPENIQFRPREEMERRPDFKQLIPYVIFQHTGEDGRPWVFQYTRGKGQGESRLHSKRSVGVGGHISSIDVQADGSGDPYQEGMRRELDEEVVIRTEYRMRVIGMINDDQTEVGTVHLGVVHLCEVDRPEVFPRESEIIEAGFRPVEELLADLDGFETWSSYCLKGIYE